MSKCKLLLRNVSDGNVTVLLMKNDFHFLRVEPKAATH